MLLSLIFLTQFLLADGGTPLEAINVQYQEVSQGASCALLKHREIERDKVIREHIHLSEQNFSSDLEKAMKLNHFMSNQYFLDEDFWTDEFMEVSMDIHLPESFLNEVNNENWDQTYLEIDGLGFFWSAPLINFPEDVEVQFDIENKQLHLTYFIYRADYCFFPDQKPQITWFNQEEVVAGTPMKEESYNELINLRH